jgi:hypothetical protein
MRGHRRYFVLQVQQPQHSKNLHSLAKQIRKNFASQNHKFPQKPKFKKKKTRKCRPRIASAAAASRVLGFMVSGSTQNQVEN